jgi:hypothetical protein
LGNISQSLVRVEQSGGGALSMARANPQLDAQARAAEN